MNLLYTELRDNGALLGDMPVYEITNIFDYLSANNFAALNQYAIKEQWQSAPEWSHGQKQISLNEIPNVFAPFPEFWMEYSYSVEGQPVTCGQHFCALKQGDDRHWLADMWVRDSHEIYSADVVYAKTDANGYITELRSPSTFATDSKEWMEMFTCLSFCFVAISFLNMHKNSVRVATNPPSRQVRRAAQRKGVKPPPDFKTILVRGMGGKSYANSGSGNGDSKPYALHIVRGHMLTSTQAAPIFGCDLCRTGTGHGPTKELSHVGSFWIESHTRGDINSGDQTRVPFRVKVAA